VSRREKIKGALRSLLIGRAACWLLRTARRGAHMQHAAPRSLRSLCTPRHSRTGVAMHCLTLPRIVLSCLVLSCLVLSCLDVRQCTAPPCTSITPCRLQTNVATAKTRGGTSAEGAPAPSAGAAAPQATDAPAPLPARPLSDAELAELVEENRQLRALLETYVDRLAEAQVDALRAQFEEIRVLAAGSGVDLGPLPLPGAAAAAAARADELAEALSATTEPPPTPLPAGPLRGSSTAEATPTPPPAATHKPPQPVALQAATPEGEAKAALPAVPEGDHWIDQRGRAGSDDDRRSPQLSAVQKVSAGNGARGAGPNALHCVAAEST
jgi:hypothetical protein